MLHCKSSKAGFVRPSKILNLSAFAFDAIWAFLLAYLVVSFCIHTLEMLDEQTFNTIVKTRFGSYNDFRAYYAVGKIAISDQPREVLNPEVQRQFYCRFSTPPGASCADYSEIPYAPIFAVLMMPFAGLPLNVSYVVWSFMGIVGFAAGITLLGFSRSERASPIVPVAVVIGTLASLPALRCLILGQASFVIAALIALYFMLWMRGHERLAGVVMALTTFKIQFIPYTLIPALAQKKWRILVSFAITELVLFGVAFAVLGEKPFVDYVSLTTRMGGRPWQDAYTMLCVRSIYSYLPHGIAIALSILTCLAGIAAVYLLWRSAPALDSGRSSCWLIASSIVLLLLTSVYSNLYDGVLIAVAAVLTLRTVGVKTLLEPDFRYKLWWLILFTYPITSWIVWLVLGRENHFTYHWSTLMLGVLTALGLSLVLRPPAANQASPADGESPQ